MVTLIGVGGVGKTTVAVEAAWIEVSAGRAELACYIDLVPCRTEDQVVAALVEGMGIRGAQAAAGLDAVVDAVSGCRSLLVIDNCEHVLESARRACGQLAGRAADLRLLVTSRIPLDVEPECVWQVPPMAVPREADRPAMTEAVSLFYARAAMAGVTLQAGPAELGLASTICHQAGGLPLAIELAANRLRVASLTELAEGLAELEGRYDDAKSWYEQAVGHAAACRLPADAARARHHLARLAWLGGDRASAVNGCHEALAGQLEAADQLGMVETLETLDGVLVDEGSARRGLPLLAAATAGREALGFPWRPMEAERIAGWIATGREQLSEQAQSAWERGAGLSIGEAAMMARRGRGPRRRPAFGWPSLTPAERDVADLVARGLTNPEIAARLGVSAGTVKDHVSSALRKLGVRTRAELAAAVSGRAAM